MKKLLLLLSILVSVNTFADISRSAFFNFNQPSSLSPAITPASGSGEVVPINSTVFTNGFIEVSFELVEDWVIGAQIFTYKNPYDGTITYYLRLTNGTKMRFRALGGSKINSISFSDLSKVGSLNMDADFIGVGTQSNTNHLWEAGDAGVSEVAFRAYSNTAEIFQMTVEYTEPSAVLYPVWTNYVNGGTIPVFDTFQLCFGSPITLQNSGSIHVSHSGGSLSPVINTSGDTLKIKLEPSITKDDLVKVTIDARAIRTTDLYENTSLSYTIPVHEPRSTFECESVDPVPGRVTEIPNPIKLKFPKPILLDEEKTEVIVFKGDEPFFATHLTKDADDEMTALISYSGHYTDNGVYRFVIKEGAVHTTFLGTSVEEQSDRWNPADTLVYEISDEPEPEPEPEPQPEDSEVMTLAKNLLSMSGVGYPTDDAPARVALKTLTTAEETPEDADIEAAIEAYYKETNVELPTKDEWYNIIGVNSKGNKLYVTLEEEGTRAYISKDSAMAASFQAVAVDGDARTIVFKTVDGKFLHVLSALRNYDKTSETCLTDEQSEVNELKFEKFAASMLEDEEVTDSMLFGKFTMRGLLGTNEDTESTDEAYARLRFDQERISTALVDNFTFNDKNSNAFIIVPATKPAEEIIDPVVTLRPDSIGKDTETMTLAFYNATKVSLKAAEKIYFRVQGKEAKIATTAGSILTPVDNSEFEFVVHVNGLAKGTYELVMPTGTFDFTKNAKAVNDKELVAAFRLGVGGGTTPDDPDPGTEPFDPVPGEFKTYNVISWLQEIERTEENIDCIPDYELNNFVLFQYKDTIFIPKMDGYEGDVIPVDTIVTGWGLYADPTKEVKISSYWNANVVIATGHFEPVADMADYGYEHYQGIRLVLDSPIEPGALDGKEGMYSYVVSAATYGDGNFGKYLKDPTSVSQSKCKVNKHMAFNVMVDNEKARQRLDKINNVNVATRKSVIYDLQGRRHQSGSLKPGLYIIDGKKRIVK